MNVTTVLLDILVVLLAAKVAAEVAERVGVPAVVGEILAGILIGPSALGFVGGDEVLRVLGELGVILLLLEVGQEMDLVELAAVGRASLLVALVGVSVSFVAGSAAALAFSMTGREALYVGAAISATSVGITARVFGDLRALATIEARTVVGAAIADDVIGLVILTVVVRIAAQGSVSLGTVLGVVAVAVAFLIVTTAVGIRLAPPLFAALARHSRSSGTVVAVALAFTLGVAELAHAAKLAPIIGAFVAGLSLSRSSAAPRIRRELTPVGHLLIPVFFLQIGIDAEVGRFADGRVLRLAGVLLAVSVAGKLVASLGMLGSPGDRLLVGIGMIPRGEVVLIFATLGLSQRVFGPDVYAALLLVVLVTTLLTPPALRYRLLRLRAGRSPGTRAAAVEPAGGWLRVEETASGPVVELVAEPGPDRTLAVALEAAVLAEKARPGASVLDWLSALPPGPLRWNAEARKRFFELLDAGGPRSWRLLALTDVLERALPELGEALARRQADAAELDPLAALRWPRLARLQELGGLASLVHPERVRLAAVLLDATEDQAATSPVVVARRIAQRLDLGAGTEEALAQMVADADLLAAAAHRPDAFTEEAVLQLATHLGSVEQAKAEFVLARSDDRLDDTELRRLAQLEDLVLSAVSRPELTGREARNALEERRLSACRLTTDPEVQERVETAPRAYVLATQAEDLVAHARLCEPLPSGDTVRVSVIPGVGGDEWRVSLAARDRPGLLASTTGVLAEHGLDIADATVAVWGDGCALEAFRVQGPAPDPGALEADLKAAIGARPAPLAVPDAVITFDDSASPWHTICTVRAPDRLGLLHAVTAAFAAAGVDVHSARVATAGGEVVDVFELTDTKDRKLGPDVCDHVRVLLATGVAANGRGWLGRKRRHRRVGA